MVDKFIVADSTCEVESAGCCGFDVVGFFELDIGELVAVVCVCVCVVEKGSEMNLVSTMCVYEGREARITPRGGRETY